MNLPSQQHRASSSPARRFSFVAILLLSFIQGSAFLLLAAVAMHSEAILEAIEETHSSMIDSHFVGLVTRRSLLRRIRRRGSMEFCL